MKFYRNTVILLVVVGLLAGAYFIIKNKKGPDKTNTDESAIKVFQLDSSKITEIDLSNKDGNFVFNKKDKTWTLTAGGKFKADSSKVDSIAADMASLTAEKIIDENASNLAQYGLSSPKTSVTAKASDGTVKTVQIGDKTPTGEGYYIKERENNKVYTISTYTGDTLMPGKNDLRDKTLFTLKPEDIINLGVYKNGANVFQAKKTEDSNWAMTAPIEGNADVSKIGTITEAISKVSTVTAFVEDNPADLQKYGLKNPGYALEFQTSGMKKKILLGDEKVKGSEIYAKTSDSTEVFTLDESSLNFLDRPFKEFMDPFVYNANIDDVNKVVVDMDGQTTTCEIQTNKDDHDKDKFTVNGKDASMKDSSGGRPFSKFFEALAAVPLSDIDMVIKPAGKADITFTYYLKKEPGTIKIEFISKDNNYYYVVKNGKYSSILVEKDKFNQTDGVRDSLKKLMEAVNKK